MTVPDLGLGIFWARMRPSSLPIEGIMSGVATATSKSLKPPLTRSIRSASPTTSAPASCAARAASPRANTITRTVRPVPCGRLTVPRTFWSDFLGSTPSLMWISTVSLNFAVAFFFTSAAASSGAKSCSRSKLAARFL